MKLYDTLSGKKKVLKPLKQKRVELFVCGPTVYDYSHIGHARTYIAFDAFVKYLRTSGYRVRYVQNITDLDDKIIDRARELNESPQQLAHNFEIEYYQDMDALNIDSVDKYARAMDYIKQIIDQIERLIKRGYAYKATDGIYYDISKFREYGKLSNRTIQQAEDAVSRIDESVQKRNKGDFALWKLSPSTNADDEKSRKSKSASEQKFIEPRWKSPWGDGRPGWHIEDTAITEQEFSVRYDIHGGARDLIFPHHESEIAQMEAISGKEPLVNHWMHTGFLTVLGEKMSKSLGNFVTIRKFLKTYSKETLRLFVLSSHYRSPLDYTDKTVLQAESNVSRLNELFQKLSKLKTGHTKFKLGGDVKKILDSTNKNFERELNDDFNTPKALSVIFTLVREINTLLDKNKINPEEARAVRKFLKNIDAIFGIIPIKTAARVPEKIIELVRKREELRKAKKWQEADKARAQIKKRGYLVEDTLSGPEIKTTD